MCALWPYQLDWQQLDEYAHDNEYIKKHYRYLPNIGYAIKSIWYLHNETGNIWLHLLGAIGMAIWTAIQPNEGNHKISSWWYLNGVGSVFCLLTSASFHTFMHVSESHFRVFSKLDYLGITVVIFTAFLSNLFTMVHTVNFRTAMVSVMVATMIAVLLLIFTPGTDGPKFRSIRGGVFFAFGLQMLLPVIFSQTHLDANYYMLTAAELITFVIAVCIFIARWPECRCGGGNYDLCGHSHQIFHALVVIAFVLHQLALLRVN